jgi:divalent metal cation (Fe/Co/Zn/Cd) transporter
MSEGSTRAIFAAFLANLGIATVKFVAFLFTGAASMLAESIHSVADPGNQALRRGGRHPGGAG